MKVPSVGCMSVLFLLVTPSIALDYLRDYENHDYYAVHLRPHVDPVNVSSSLGLHFDGPLGELEDHYIFRAGSRQQDHDHIQTAIRELKWRRRKREAGANQHHVLDHVLLSQKQELHKRFPLVKREIPSRQDLPVDSLVQKGRDVAARFSIDDPIFQDQWHLFNHVQPGHDINVTGVWEQGITGKDSTVCLVDDGLDFDSDDIKDNYFRAGSHDFNDPGDDPKPRLADDRHGTRCAGEVAAVKNNVCGVGVAWDSKVSGVRILSKIISDVDEAVAMNYAFQDNHIYSCSWGPPDDGKAMEGPGILIRRAMVTGVQKGRGGLGSIYVFAIGNGAANDDNCNFDGYTNSIYSVSVGAIDRKGLHPYYSEPCSAQLVVTYSSGSGDAIHTTDIGQNTCYSNHGGTSAAGPLVAGMYALVLQANPSLSWRDMQWITVLSAVKVDQPSDWQMNKAVGKEFSHQFGFGKADAYALVETAKTWTKVKPQAWYVSPWMHVNSEIPQGDQGLTSSFEVTQDMLSEANLERLEHVTVTMNVEHGRRGDLSAELRSPSGMVSHIATARRHDESPAGYKDWTFMSVAHWGESGVGIWTVIVKDTTVNDNTGSFTDWRLTLWGESVDASKQDLLPLPTEHDDDDHDEVHFPSVGVTSVAIPTKTGTPQGNPDDHPERPVNSKVSPTPTSSLPPEAQGDKEETTPSASPSPSASNFLPHPFPTFGVSKRTQIWIYGAIALILTFLICLGGWFYYMRRKRRRMERDEYSFEMLDHDDFDDAPGMNGHAGKKPRRRAGELYDAFAEGSDEEEPFRVGEDEEGDDEGMLDRHNRYRDDEPFREGTDVR